MNTLTARGYMTSRLDREKLENLHRKERSDGYCWTPHQIHAHFYLPEIGEIAEPVYRQSESVVRAIYEKARGRFKSEHVGCCFQPYSLDQEKDCPDIPDVFVQHETDKKIMSEQVEFPTGSGGKLRDRFGGQSREEAA